jgi:predicted RNase H-like HicB family nuclease
VSCPQGRPQATHKVMENIKDAIKLHVEDRIESGEDIQQSESVSLTLMEVLACVLTS